MGSIPGSGRSPGGRNGNPLHYFCQENLRDRGAWWTVVQGVTKSGTQLERLSSSSIPTSVTLKSQSMSCTASFWNTQSCPTLCDPMDDIVHGLLQARILEWVTYPFSRGSSRPRNWTALQVDSLPADLPGKFIYIYVYICIYVCVYIYIYILIESL